MTNEEAIKDLKRLLRWYVKEEPMSETMYKREAVQMAIKALEFDLDKHDEDVIKNTVETLFGEPCEDCVSREEVLKYIKSSKEWLYRNENFDIDMQTSFEDIEKFTNNLPSVQPKQRVGRWERTEYSPGLCNYHCSECHNISLDIGNYCPNCGAKMEEG